MDWQASTFWWVASGVVVAAELATGTLYLLMIALGLACAAIAAHLGLSSSAQIVVAALVGGGTTALWHWKRAREPRSAPVQLNRDANLDIGEHVHVQAWNADGSTRVSHRGSTWAARLAAGASAAPGTYRVAGVEGNWLLLEPVEPGR